MIRFEGRSLMGDRDDIPVITLVTPNACYFTVKEVRFVVVMTKKEFPLGNFRLDLDDVKDWRRLDDIHDDFVTEDFKFDIGQMRRKLQHVKISPLQVIRSACIRKKERYEIDEDLKISLPLQICGINWAGNEEPFGLVKVSKD